MRQAFEGDVDAIQKPDNMSNEVFERFKSRAKSLKEYFDTNGEIPIANGIVVFNKIGDKRIAGELDLLTYNKYTGEFRFYDFKTSKYRFYTDEGKLDTHYTTVWHNRQIRSTQEQYTRQLSAYNDLFTSRYGTPVVNMALIPLIINYNDKGITAFNAEPTINITYQPSEFMQGTTVSTPKVDNNTIPASNVKTLELSDTKKVKVDISTLPVVTTINGSEIKAYIEEVKSVNNSTKEVTTFYSPYMVFPNGEVTYMNGRRELLNSEELEENKKTWASTIQANKDAFIQAGLVNAKPQEETKSETKPEVNINYDTNNVFIGGEFGTGTINITDGWIGVSEDPRVWSKDKTVPVFSEVKMKDGSVVTIISYRNAEKFGNNRGTNGIIINIKGKLTDSNKEYIKNTLINTNFSNSKEELTKQVLDILNNSNTKTVTPSTSINIIDNTQTDTTPTGPQSAEEDLLKAMSLLNTYNKEAPDGTLGKEEIKPRTDVEEQTGRNADNNIVVDNPEALKKWNELNEDTRELLRLMNINEDAWNKMLPKQRESELNCLS